MRPHHRGRTVLSSALVAAACGLAATCGRIAPPDGADGARTPYGQLPVSTDTSLRRIDAPGLGARAFAHVETLVGFGPRFPGSQGWRNAIGYIRSELVAAGVEPVLDRWTEEAEDLELCNLSARIEGARPERIVIGCHHDTKRCEGHDDPAHNFDFVGANDSGSGVGLLLALAHALRNGAIDPLPVTVDLVFFDGEESVPFVWDLDRALFGSRRYVRRDRERRMVGEADGEILAFVLLDLVGSRDLQIDDDARSDARLKKIVLSAALAHGHGDTFFKTFTDVADDHVPFLQAGIPAVDLIDIADNPQWHTPDDTLEHLAPESLQTVGEVVLTALPEIARTFLSDRGDGGLRLGAPNREGR